MFNEFVGMLAPLVKLIVIDIIVGLIAMILIGMLAKGKRATYAVLKRNFLGYFSNPTGYVFLCLFVLLTSMAAFWPYEFFNLNLANLDQLSVWFPMIMLFFIPAITMSIWADEKRQGTDELLLTLPADDFDIVIGKYLSVASIYTVSLVFSQLSTFLVLLFLSKGEVDTGLFFANYLGYWLIGLAMLSIGMIASFLTHNLTVGFILGALFNAPLVFASMSDVILANNPVLRGIKNFSIREQFDSFGRGVVSIAPVAYFSLILVIGLYLCMVLIGRRHWSGGENGNIKFLHYLARVILLVVSVFAISYFFKYNDRPRYDATEGQVSSLSPTTLDLIRKLSPERPIVIDAYISDDIPEQYAKTRYDLMTLLKEFQALATSRRVKLQVDIHDGLQVRGDEAKRAKKQYGIEPQSVRVQERGAFQDKSILLGAAVRSGLSKVIIPFFESGIPVEYELVRSINTVAKPRRARLGIVNTDANLMGGFSMAGGNFEQIPKQPIVEELEKQYEVTAVDPSTPISTDQFDVLLAVQPSSLNPQQMRNVLEAIRNGVPTAVFEDPFPFAYQGIPGTGQPKQAAGMMGMQQPQPKADMSQMQDLWKTLGLEVPVNSGFEGINPDIAWQSYNPHKKLQAINNATDQWLFILDTPGDEGKYLSNQSPITNGLRELMFLYAGSVKPAKNRDDVQVTELVKTREDVSGLIKFEQLSNEMSSRNASVTQLKVFQGNPTGSQTIAVYVEGIAKTESNSADAKAIEDVNLQTASGEGGAASEQAQVAEAKPAGDDGPKQLVKAVYVTDVDCMHPFFSENRKRPEEFKELDLRLQNITFVLNVVDVLAGEVDYPAIRNHEPQHVSLRLFEDEAEDYQLSEIENQKKYQEEFNAQLKSVEESNQSAVAEFKERVEKLKREGATDVSKQAEIISTLQQLQIRSAALERKFAIAQEKMEAELDEKIQESRREAENKVLGLQNFYKLMAIAIPPIPPLLVGIGVFVTRRVKEREGISKSRLR